MKKYWLRKSESRYILYKKRWKNIDWESQRVEKRQKLLECSYVLYENRQKKVDWESQRVGTCCMKKDEKFGSIVRLCGNL